jgi:hypothetical protein
MESQLRGLEGTFSEGNTLSTKVAVIEGKCMQIQEDYRKMRRENERLELIIYTCFKNNARNDQWIGGLEQALHNITSFSLIESQITQDIEAENKQTLRGMQDMRKAKREKRNLQAKTLDKVAEQFLAKIQLKEAFLRYEEVIKSANVTESTREHSELQVVSVRSQSPRQAERLETAFRDLSAMLKVDDPIESLAVVMGVLERGKELDMQIQAISNKVEGLETVKMQLQAQWNVLKATNTGLEDAYIDVERISNLQKQLKQKTKELETAAEYSAEAEERLARVLQCLENTAKAVDFPSIPASFEPIADRLVEMMTVIPREKLEKPIVSPPSAVLMTQAAAQEEEITPKQSFARSKHLEVLKALLRASQDGPA